MIPPSPQPPSGSSNATLEKKIRQLRQDNDLLWDHVAWLLCCLLEKGIISEEDATKYSTSLRARTAPVVLDADSEKLIQNLPVDAEDPFFRMIEPEIATAEEKMEAVKEPTDEPQSSDP